jgi:hypothetical protein
MKKIFIPTYTEKDRRKHQKFLKTIANRQDVQRIIDFIDACRKELREASDALDRFRSETSHILPKC